MGLRRWNRILLTAALAASQLPSPLLASGMAERTPAPERPLPADTAASDWLAQATGPLELKLRRLPDAVEVVVHNAGTAPQLMQTTRGATWLGQLQLGSPASLRLGGQRVALPEAGLQSVSLEGSGSSFRLEVTPVAGQPLGRPVVSADGRDLILTFNAPARTTLQTGQVDRNRPGRLPQPAFVPPLRPRAVAPPVGDIAVGTMLLRNLGAITASGPPVTMTLRNAPARDVLMTLAMMGNYGFVYVDETAPAGGTTGSGNAATATNQQRTVSIAFRNEPYGQALNAVLIAAGLQGKREGNTIYAGPKVHSKSFGARLSKVYRLNQVTANAAADYLANLGALVTKTNTITTAVTEGATQNTTISGGPNASTTQSSTQTTVESYGATSGPLLGLQATTDNRLQAITLVGDPTLVAVAEQYLKQLDLRQRQVALNVKIIDVTLDNESDINNSFAFRYGNNFIVNADGELLGAWNDKLPPTNVEFFKMTGGADNAKPIYIDPTTQSAIIRNPLASAPVNPGAAYDRGNFYNFLQAKLVSQSAKVLANPTLILQDNPSFLREAGSTSSSSSSSGGESLDSYNIDSPIGRKRGNEAVVRVGENVPTKVSIVQANLNGTTTCSIDQLSTAGLVLGARLERIDDNGFVTFSLSPSISAVTDLLRTGSNCPDIRILSVRRLDTGSIRVRDGQTLILTGVISDEDYAEVTKWPIVGDIPLIGQFFRASSNKRRKRELVVMVSPRIVNDVEGGVYGYGYQPATQDMRQMLRGPGG